MFCLYIHTVIKVLRGLGEGKKLYLQVGLGITMFYTLGYSTQTLYRELLSEVLRTQRDDRLAGSLKIHAGMHTGIFIFPSSVVRPT